MNFSFLRDVTVVSFLAPCFAHQRFTKLSAYSRGLAIASLLSVVLRFDLVFGHILNHKFVLSTLLVVHGPNWLPAMWEPLGVGGQPRASLRHRQHSTGGWTRLVSRAHASEVKTYTGMRFGLHQYRRHLVCVFSTPKEKNKSPAKSVLHPLTEGLTRDDPLAARQSFMFPWYKASKPLSPLEKAQVGSAEGRERKR